MNVVYLTDDKYGREDAGVLPKRTRYNSALLDANITEPGEDFEKLSETYVIFITENDVIGCGLPLYHIERTILETGEAFGDCAHILYVNSKVQDDTALGRLMHDFYCTEADDMYNQVLANRVRHFKDDEKGVLNMSMYLDKWSLKDIARGRAEGINQFAKALTLLRSGECVTVQDLINKDIYEDVAEMAVQFEQNGSVE